MTSENKPSGFLLFTVFAIACILIAFVATIVFGDSCTALSCGTIKGETVVANEEVIWSESHELIRLLREATLPEVTEIDELYDQICAKVPNSPICGDKELLQRIDIIGKSKGVPTRLLIGIAYAESHIGVNFNREACRNYNNFFGAKGKKHDNGKVEWFTKDRKKDSNGCGLYKFKSIEEGFYSLANTISIGYAGCNNSVRCLSRKYVGHPDIEEESWINRVSLFLK